MQKKTKHNGSTFNLNYHYANSFSFGFRVKDESDMILTGLRGFRPLSSVIYAGTEASWTNIALET